MAFDLGKYCGRVGIAAPAPTAEGLARLQRAQLQAITFENLDPFLGSVPKLDPPSLQSKLIDRRRGGYCFELNGLFGLALEVIGFRATPVLARVRLGQPAGGARTHLAFVVDIDGESWLADAGFGGTTPPVPLSLARGGEQKIGGERFRLRDEPESGETVVEKLMPEGWFSLYGFDRVPVRPADVEAANVVCAHWEKSPFPFHLMLSRHTAAGRLGLFDTKFTRTEQGEEISRTIAGRAELARILTEDFGLPLEPPTLDTIAARVALA